MGSAYFVTGTDTEVGKTFVSCALIEAANKAGFSTLGLKPIAAGCDEVELDSAKSQWQNEDALALMAHSSTKLSYQQVNPFALKEPASPHIAAALEKKTVVASRMQGFCRGALMNRPDFAIVEGAGGWRVPISNRETMADFAKMMDLPVILVVALRLGCLNHAMLTAEAIERDGLKVAGWIANTCSETPMNFEQENLSTLKSAIRAPMLGHIKFNLSGTPATSCNDISLDGLNL